MNPTPTLPGSRQDTRPLLSCTRCKHSKERSGGVEFGLRKRQQAGGVIQFARENRV